MAKLVTIEAFPLELLLGFLSDTAFWSQIGTFAWDNGLISVTHVLVLPVTVSSPQRGSEGNAFYAPPKVLFMNTALFTNTVLFTRIVLFTYTVLFMNTTLFTNTVLFVHTYGCTIHSRCWSHRITYSVDVMDDITRQSFHQTNNPTKVDK